MKHCHFSILYNELPFIKRKLPFLYKHFDQIIFFDLNINVDDENFHYSTDGSHEFIMNYPDPESKITLIEKKCLSDVEVFFGKSSISKRKMFAVGSSFVKDNIDAFWCTDMDEFFSKSLIKKVENKFTTEDDVNSIDLPHYVFFKDHKHVFADLRSDKMILYPRIARHKPGNIYGHCSLGDQYLRTAYIKDENYYHFAFVGEKRMQFKFDYYSKNGNEELYKDYVKNIWSIDLQKLDLEEGYLYGYPHMHTRRGPAGKGIVKVNLDFPDYLDAQKMVEELESL